MRDPNRIPKIIFKLGEIWQRNSDLRLGQLICNCFQDPYFIEDQELINKLDLLYKKSK